MKKLILIVILAAMVTPAFAYPTVTFTHFLPTIGKLSDGTVLTTFCVEGSPDIRYFNYNTEYSYTIDEDVQYGGDGSISEPNPPEGFVLKDTTKMIYSAYLNGAFTGANFKTATQIQNAVWASQAGSLTDSDNNGIADIVDGLDYSGWKNIKVLNVWLKGKEYTAAGDKQSQMIRVPVPGAFLLGGLGVACVGWIKRRRML